MSPTSKMGDEVMQKRWELRRTGNDDNSSSDKSKSSSEAAHKRHKMVPGLVSHEDEGEIGDCRVQQTGMCNPPTEDQVMVQNGKKRHLRRSRKGNLTCNGMARDFSKVGRKKSKINVYDPAILDELKVFTDTLLKDLKVTRENLFSWMRKEMQKLVDKKADPRLERRERSSGQKNVQENILVQLENRFEKDVLQQCQSNSEENVFAQHHDTVKEAIQVKHQDNLEEVRFQVNYQNNFDSRMKGQQCDIGSSERSAKSNTSAAYDNFQSCFADKNVQVPNQMNYLSGSGAQTYSCRSSGSSLIGEKTAQVNSMHPFIESGFDCAQETGPRASSGKEIRGRLGLSNSPLNLLSQVTASMFSTLPSMLAEPYGRNYMFSPSLSNYTRKSFDANKLEVNSAEANRMFKVNGQQERLSCVEQEERSGSLPQIGSRNLSCFDKQSIPSSSVEARFQDPLHRGSNIGVSIPNQVPFEHLPQEEKNIISLRMDEGALRFSGGRYAVSEDYLANNFYSHFN